MNSSFFENCAFVCVDLQEGEQGPPVTEETMPKSWRENGFSPEDINAANDYLHLVCLPNAARVAEFCLQRGMPRIFIHWGYLFEDGMDLDPKVRQEFLNQYGTDYSKWPHHLSHSSSRPHKSLGVQGGDYVLPKSAQDAFTSCNLEFVLRNLEIENIVFVGGHTGACLGKTAASAKKLGFKILCVEDATCDARESARIPNIVAVGYDYVVGTEELLAALDKK
jgi:nicotinamidase-related amidase